MPLTPEQQALAKAVVSGLPKVKGVAAAGTGKTRTLQTIAAACTQRQKKKVLYNAFNKAMQLEAEAKFAGIAEARTPHSMAYKATRVRFWGSHKLNARAWPTDIVKELGLRSSAAFRSPVEQAAMLQKAVDAFCQSADRELSVQHCLAAGARSEEIATSMVENAMKLWDAMTDSKNRMAMTHDTYLKLWQLDDPVLPYDVILYDEAQDASPVMMDIVQRQAHAQQVWVGDPFQELYAWRGACNAMLQIDAPEFHLSQSFRFTPEVAALANAILDLGPTPRHFEIKGTETPKDLAGTCYISRTNGMLFEQAVFLQQKGRRFSVVGGFDATLRLVRSAHALRYGEKMQTPMAPEISRFRDWKELCDWANAFDDRELKFLVRTIRNHGYDTARLCTKLARAEVPEGESEDILSTGHKVKGREFGRAILAEDFAVPTDDKWQRMTDGERQAEINVLYVAGTRGVRDPVLPDKVEELVGGMGHDQALLRQSSEDMDDGYQPRVAMG